MGEVVSSICACTGNKLRAHIEESQWLQVREVIEKRKDDPGALLQILHDVQGIIGYLPIEVQEAVAEGLEIPLSEVYGAVTFYSYFTMVPRGKHTIRVCLGTACYVRGGRKVLDGLKDALGIDVKGTTDDRNFSLEIVRCIGACGLSPVMTVDEDIYRRVKPSKVGEALYKYRAEEDLSSS